jgi:uncharacterized Zn finger protein
LLVHIYLHEEEWDLAWAALEQMPAGYRYANLELEAAVTSQHARPHKAIPVYVKYARQNIGGRKRDYYREAARMLSEAKKLYQKIEDVREWDKLITSLKEEFSNLPALQDELRKARL